jgi:hypothetical protein
VIKAEKIPAAPDPSRISTACPPMLQRTCACGGSGSAGGGECEECKKKTVQRRAAGGAGPAVAPPIVHDVLRSPGRPLDAATRAFFEPRFGHDFSKVRLHTDARAAESAQSVQALAYTVGSDIVFGAGQYQPVGARGMQLLGHELTHVVQQRGHAGATGPLRVGPPADAYEREASRASQNLGLENPGLEQGAAPAAGPVALQRDPQPNQTQNNPTTQGCCCCVDDLQIYDPFIYKPPQMGPNLAGHIFTTKVKMSYKGSGAKSSCALEWWEKTDRPYLLVLQPNTWTNLAGNPQAKSIGNWKTERKEPCPGQDAFNMVDSPGLGLSPGMNATRTLEFRIGINSGSGCTDCGNKSKRVTARQFLQVTNGVLDENASKFESPNPNDTSWK